VQRIDGRDVVSCPHADGLYRATGGCGIPKRGASLVLSGLTAGEKIATRKRVLPEPSSVKALRRTRMINRLSPLLSAPLVCCISHGRLGLYGLWQLFLLPIDACRHYQQTGQIQTHRPGSRTRRSGEARLPFRSRPPSRAGRSGKHAPSPATGSARSQPSSKKLGPVFHAQRLPSACLKRDPICLWRRTGGWARSHGLGRDFMYSVEFANPGEKARR